MGADLSRERFDPRRDYRGVVMQQGRVLLDADWNEQSEVLDRRLRTAALDLAPAGPPATGGTGWVSISRATPDAFKLTATAGGLTLGRGRLYVDGLLAENHGAGPEVFDPVLAEPTGSTDPVLAEPAGSTDPRAPVHLPQGGPHLVYLDVWQREVTYLEEPDLVEPALGVDTTARVQTTWRIRVLPNVGTKVSCDTPLDTVPGWAAAHPPAGGRLTVRTVPVPPEQDICDVPPAGGYRGPENQLYRVEIHDGGTAPSFKWSRDNGSVASTAEVVSATELRPASLGRDDVLRFAGGDLVEILDDAREFAGRPGELRQVTVTEGGTLTFDAALPTDLTTNPTGLRVRRWDQRGIVRDVAGATVVDLSADPSGVIPVRTDGTQVVLEYGLTVEFSVPQGGFRTGDYWLFAARTDTTVEELTDAPPLGVHHHFVKLGLVTEPGRGITGPGRGVRHAEVTDCRPSSTVDGGGGCCDTCVTPEDSLAEAVRAVAGRGGGTVRLCAGTYFLAKPLVLTGRHPVRLVGQGGATILHAMSGPAIVLARTEGASVERLAVACDAGNQPAVLLSNCLDCRIEDVMVDMGKDVKDGTPAIGLAGVQLGTAIRRCTVKAPVGVAGTDRFQAGPDQKGPSLLTVDLRIEDNAWQCEQHGVDLSVPSVHFNDARVTGNVVAGCRDTAITVTGLVGGDAVLAELPRTAVVLGPAALTIADNVIRTAGGSGIVAGTTAVIAGNRITGETRTAGQAGIRITAGALAAPPGDCRVVANHITTIGGYGVQVDQPPRRLTVSDNVVRDATGGITYQPGSPPADRTGPVLSIVDNELTDLAGPALDEPPPTVPVSAGVYVVGSGPLDITGNVIRAVSAPKGTHAGVFVAVCPDARIHGNRVAAIGTPDTGGESMGLAVFGPYGTVHLSDNQVGPDLAPQPVPRDRWQAVFVGAAPRTRTFVHLDLRTGPVTLVDGHPHLAAAATGAATLAGNTVFGGGNQPALTLGTASSALLHANRCVQPDGAKRPAADVTATDVAIEGNHFSGGAQPSLAITADPKRIAVLGNLTSRGIEVQGGPLGDPWRPLNPVLP
jgi:hypothetical protein